MPINGLNPQPDSPALKEILAGNDVGDVRDGVGLAVHGRVAVIALSNPGRLNVLNLSGWRRVSQIMQQLDDANVSVVVLRGAGEDAFAAGADISEFPQARMTPAAAVQYNEAIALALRGITESVCPVIAMLQGFAVGGGCELACACDIRVCSDDAQLGIPIGRLGVTLGYTETLALLRLIGPARLKWLLMSGELVTAETAFSIGLVDKVVPRSLLAESTADLVTAIQQSSQATIRAAKAVTNMAVRQLRPEDTEALTRIAIEVYGGEDLAEGVSAFLAHRHPKFAP